MFIDEAALKAAEALEAARADGGEDLLDTRAGASSLSPETVQFLEAKRQYAVARLDWVRRALALHGESVSNGYIERKEFDVPAAVKDELERKLAQMADFAAEFRKVVLGADAATFAVAEPADGAKKKK